MKWFGRAKESLWLREAESRAKKGISQITVLSGPRRVGKTSLVQNTFKHTPFLYFHVSNKGEEGLCAIYQKEIEEKLHIEVIGQLNRFEQVLKYIMQYSRNEPITLFIDEFQEFRKINTSIYADIQKVWDIEKQQAHLNLIVAGSAKTMLLLLFEHHDQPLYGRQSQIIRLEHFYPSVLKDILSYYNPNYSNDDLLALYSFTGGIARYVEVLMDEGATTKEKMIKTIIKSNSIFLMEAKNHIIEEFGKDADVYFKILSAIATGHTSRSAIEDCIGKEIGGYLNVLEETYSLIHKHQPIFSTTMRSLHYELWDNFYIFWFRYIFRYNYMIEINAWDKLQRIISEDYDTYTGKRLERYFRDLFIETGNYTQIDSWWNRTGTEEIDLIAINELDKTADICEIKRQAKEYHESQFQERTKNFLTATRSLKGYNIILHGLSLENM